MAATVILVVVKVIAVTIDSKLSSRMQSFNQASHHEDDGLLTDAVAVAIEPVGA